jgi:hypothetical protein
MAKITIKPSKRGSFTAAAKRSGQSVPAKTASVLAPGSKASPALKKKAQFAKNSKSWNKGGK